MSQLFGDVATRLRRALVVVLAAAGAVLVPSLLATTATTPSAAVLAAVAVATVAAVLGQQGTLLTVTIGPLGLPARNGDAAPSFLAERVTDAARNPLRPRAPGLV